MMNILCGAVVVVGGTTMFLICPATNILVDGSSVAAVHWRQRGGDRQRGGGVGSAAVVAAELGGGLIKLANFFFCLNDFFMHEWC
jgi:hypothetical protein